MQPEPVSPGPSPSAGIVLVCFAVKEEAAFFRELVRQSLRVRTLVTGMGRVNAERELRRALAEGGNAPSMVITSGFAGGLSPGAHAGDVFFETDSGSLREWWTPAGARPGRFHCADRVAATSEEKRTLAAQTGADAVEMESGAVREVCKERGLPCVTVRVILDPVGDDLPLDFNQVLDHNLEMDARKLALALLKRPGSVPRLLRFQRQARAAARRLADVLCAGLATVIRE